MISLLLRVGPWIICALMGATVGFTGAKIFYGSKLNAERAARANEHAAAALALASAEADNRQTEQRLQANVDTHRKELEDAKRDNQGLAVKIQRFTVDAVDVVGLRDKLAAARRAASKTAESAAAACDARAATYEEVLAASDRLIARGENLAGRCSNFAAEVSLAHDDRAAEVEETLGAWPQ